MKVAALLLGLFLAVSSGCFSQQITKIEVLSVPMDLETSYNVDCMNYDFSFQNIVDKRTITDITEISRIVTTVNGLPAANNNIYPAPDTRIKLRLFSGNDAVSEVCIGKFTVLKDGGIYLYSDDMLNLLDDLPKQKQQEARAGAQQEVKIEFNTVRQYKGFLGTAMGTISFDNGNNFYYDIEGSTLREKLLGTFERNNDTINCTVHKSLKNLFEKGDELKFMIKSDTLFQFNSENEPDRSRPLTRIR
jgi:hypothetical protein